MNKFISVNKKQPEGGGSCGWDGVWHGFILEKRTLKKRNHMSMIHQTLAKKRSGEQQGG